MTEEDADEYQSLILRGVQEHPESFRISPEDVRRDPLTLIIEPLNHLLLEKETPPIFRGNVLAIRGFKKPGVTFIKIDY